MFARSTLLITATALMGFTLPLAAASALPKETADANLLPSVSDGKAPDPAPTTAPLLVKKWQMPSWCTEPGQQFASGCVKPDPYSTPAAVENQDGPNEAGLVQLMARNWTHFHWWSAEDMKEETYGYDTGLDSKGVDHVEMGWPIKFHDKDNKKNQKFVFHPLLKNGEWGAKGDYKADADLSALAIVTKTCSISVSTAPIPAVTMTMMADYPWFSPTVTGGATGGCD